MPPPTLSCGEHRLARKRRQLSSRDYSEPLPTRLSARTLSGTKFEGGSSVGDPLDELMKDLRRRRANPGGDVPREPRRVGPDGDDPENPEAGAPNTSDRVRLLRGDGARRERGNARAGGGRGSGGSGGSRIGAASTRPRGYLVVSALIVVLLIAVLFGRALVDLATDVLWYQSVGYEPVLWTRINAQLGLLAAGGLVAGLVLFGNLWLAGRLAAPSSASGGRGVFRDLVDRLNEAARAAEGGRVGSTTREPIGGLSDLEGLPPLLPVGRFVLATLAGLIVLTVAGGLSSAWETVVLWQNRVPFAPDGAAITDPIFGRDITFFMFELPFLRLIQAVAAGLLIASLVVAGGRYVLAAADRGLALAMPVRLHLAVLGALTVLTIGAGYQLDKLELVYSERGVATGVSYADANAQFLAFDVLTVLSVVAAVLVVGGGFTRKMVPVGATLAVWFVASIVLGRVFPEAIQRFVVDPNQLAQERPYISNNIAMTRLAFGFASHDGTPAWDDDRRYSGDAPLTAAAIADEEDTFRNARLWDYRPLADTLDQLQRIRRYYDFFDVDTDRYEIDGVQRQVMLSARELDLSGNPNATGFVNQRIIFTHGVGLAMVPVNEVANEGQPRLFVRNLPPVSVSGAPEISEPRIYFGERASDYVVVGAKQAEFDYPRGEADPGATDAGGVETRWQGDTGIQLGSALTRLLFAVRFGDLDLLISDQVQDGSQLLFHRALEDRVPRIAPFLRYDKDPYIVVNGDGRLVYLWDAYTASDLFPHAERFSPADLDETGLGNQPFNYIRNSVKVVVDAYTGTVHYYVADPADPLIRAWQGVFPGLFRPIAELPPDLASHIRVPEEGFNVQTRMYGRYHVTDPATFFQNDDLWTVPVGQGDEQTLPSEAYYVIMRMPGEEEAEFLLLQPMVPVSRPNMIAWVAARSDAPNYGGVRVYNFPVDTTVFGPAQIEARIDQDPQISQQISLWNQSGSRVIRGNLIVVPVGDSLLYLQPVYLQSTASAFPEFQRIIVASPTHVVWSTTLGESLRLLIEAQDEGPAPGPSPTPAPSPGASPDPGTTPGATATPSPTSVPTPGVGELPDDVAALIEFANLHFDLAQEALREGDFARYGDEMRLVEEALQRLEEVAPGASAAAQPTAAP